MALAPGTRIGPYEVLAPLGAGGMGEVYRARDSRLGRDVALKVLPAAFALDAERVARFRREAQVLAALNHPHIAAIHGLEETDGLQALVLELVEGPTLAERLAHGAMPLEETLPVARQITDALEAAHEQGIVHRDLKQWLDTPFVKDEMHFSPDGRWIAYQSEEAGHTDVYVEAFPGPGQKIRVSTDGGGAPRWRGDGGELFYLTPTGMLMAVSMKPGARLEAGVPQALFQTPITNVLLGIDQYDVAADGQRFLVLAPTGDKDQPPIRVIVNWMSGLQGQ